VDYEFKVDGCLRSFSLDKKEKMFVYKDDEHEMELDIQRISSDCISVLLDGKSRLIYISQQEKARHISVGGRRFVVEDLDEECAGFKGGEESQEDLKFVKPPMPGKVIKINVKEKDTVRKNQTLAIVEAMKMENEIKASFDAVVIKIFAAAGDLVDSENPLIELESCPEDDEE
jgi:biotin carboxyl carrier protein